MFQSRSGHSFRDFLGAFAVYLPFCIVRLVLFLSLLSGTSFAEDWPQWRGLRADGISLDTGFATEWSPSHNLQWKSPLIGRGASAPIVSKEFVFITLQIGEGPMETRLPRDRENASSWEREAPLNKGVYFLIQAHHRGDGRLLWTYRIDAPKDVPSVYPTHNLASPSVVTDGEAIYSWFGTGQLVSLDFEGRLIWSRDLGADYFPFRVQRGHASSPVLYNESLLLLVDHTDSAMLLCLDKKTGVERFKVDRGSGRRSYSTPLIIHRPERDELVINADLSIDSYDPQNGKALWHAGQPVRLAVPTPIYHDGVIYTNRGYSSSPYLAVQPGADILWRSPTRGPYVSSMLYYRGLLYMATERGIVSVIDAQNGELVWRQRLENVYTASPVLAEEHVYLLAENGETVVLKAGRSPSVVSRNSLNERTLASPALSEGQIFIRSDEHLFAISSDIMR